MTASVDVYTWTCFGLSKVLTGCRLAPEPSRAGCCGCVAGACVYTVPVRGVCQCWVVHVAYGCSGDSEAVPCQADTQVYPMCGQFSFCVNGWGATGGGCSMCVDV